jgi:D-alanine transaminase
MGLVADRILEETMPDLACLNGDIMPIEAARVPIEDRGYQFGDAVYEYIASYNGRLFALEAHLDRLENSLRALAFPALSRDRVRAAILELLQRAGMDRTGIYVQISRGVAPRNHAFPPRPTPQIVMTARQVPNIPAEWIAQGVRTITVPDGRWGRCDIKTVQLLGNVLARQQALDAGAHDAIFIGPGEVVREATAANLFIRAGDRLLTHPLTPAILPGITRGVLLDICRQQDIAVQEDFFDRKALLAADEVFLTGTVIDVLPVTRIDDQAVGDGRPGPMTMALRARLQERAASPDAC